MLNKKINLLIVLLVVGLLVVGCGNGEEQVGGQADRIVIGATPVPHSEILKDVVQPLLEEEGITLEIKEFTDYVTPNLALDDGSIDANFFQHLPYLENFSNERGLDLSSIANVHVEPMGLYSEEYDFLEELEDGALIAIPNDATNEGRALLLLEAYGLIKLSDNAGLNATPIDIIDNPRNLEFRELEAAQLPRSLRDVDAAVINTNFALEADLVPTEDALIIEGSESPYANILVVREGEEDDKLIAKLVSALTAPEVREYILERYEGAVVPAF
ncbi:MetQ/NlpA family ABC transporter substrate-binding protein [Halonatronum saccharophilum]|uniref:MetQ/NlpA family ABC transporter substrate-binding protein n=1 Tax=Halonatronum saccharophilum TaxID=150060 RepID=UPI0004867323|nr:MetQ/NlpA family ABC transporter substrate-binding protein [Halonatronum saccharophilum]